MILETVLGLGLLFPNATPIDYPEPVKQIVFHVVKSQYELEQEELKREQEKIKQEQEELKQWKSGVATGYCNCHDTMNGETGITASGYDLDRGITYKGYSILAGDRSIPFGTLVDIKLSNGKIIHGIVLDRGGAIHGNHFDIVMSSRVSCFDFGRQKVTFKRVGKIDV